MAMAAGARRALIRSGKFVEWQGELGSRALYGGNCIRDDRSTEALIHYQRKSGPRNASKQKEEKKPTEQDTKEKLESANLQQKEEINKKNALPFGQQHPQEAKLSANQAQVPEHGPVQHGQKSICRMRRHAGGMTGAPSTSLRKNTPMKCSRRSSRRMLLEEPRPPPLKLPKLEIALTRKEIQEDWLKMTGHRYIGKPKKSTLVQKGLDLCTSLTCPSTIQYLHCHE